MTGKKSDPAKIKKLKTKASKLKESISTEMVGVDAALQKTPLSDNTWLKTYEQMFRKLRRIMRSVEKKVINTESSADIYALMALYNQMREVIADIRTMMDLSQNTQRIIDQVLYPLVRDVSNNYVDAIFLIKKSLRSNVDNAHYIELKADIDACLREHAKYIQSSYEKSSAALTKLLEE